MKKLIISSLLTLALQVNAFEFEKSHDSKPVQNVRQNEIITKKNNNTDKGVTIFSVGDGATCNFNTIQDAINSSAVEIRVVNDKIYQENITIDRRDFTIRGNYDSCDNANAGITAEVKSIIEGVSGAQAPVVTIAAVAEKNAQKGLSDFVNLSYLEIRNGTEGFFDGGGIAVPANSTDVELSLGHLDIHNNHNLFGGGISLKTNSRIHLFGTSIHDNSASNGGGIYCEGNGSILFNGGSNIVSNLAIKTATIGTTNGKGGGVYLSDGCSMRAFDEYNKSGVSLNKAQGEGGGFYLKSAAELEIVPSIFIDDSGQRIYRTFNIIGNEADSDHMDNENGGGIYLEGLNTIADIAEANIVGNKTSGHGGAFAVMDSAELIIKSNPEKTRCWDKTHCSYISANKAGETTFGAGGAIFNSSSTVTVTHTVFDGNRADFGTVLYATGLNSVSTFNGTILHHNGNNGANGFNDNHVIVAILEAKIDVLSSTIVDNNATLAVFDINHPDTEVESTILSSIIHDTSTGNVFDVSARNYSTDCIIAHETSSFLSVGTSSVADPLFIDRAGRDYHIQTTSPAVDGCDNFNDASSLVDIDYETRGFDDPNHANTLGSFDIGADETYKSDVIFEHGF